MSSNVSNELKEFLLNICQLDKQIVTKICDKCSSLDQFWEKRKNWIDLFGLNGEMVKKIFKFLNVLKRAQADREEFEVLQQIDMKDSNDEEVFERFYNQHKEKIKREINDITEEKIKEIYRFELNRYKQKNPLAVQVFGALMPSSNMMIPVISKLTEIVRNNPNIANGLISSIDELVAFVKDFDMFSTIKSNLLASGAMFLVLTTYSFGKHFVRWYRGDLKNAREFFISVSIDAAANAASVGLSFATGTAGMVIGSFIFPGLGTLIGGVIGGLIGFFVNRTCVEPKIKEFLGRYAIDDNEIKYKSAKALYLEALDILNVTESSTTEEIKTTRRAYLLSFHPDKTGNQLDDNETKKLMKLERSYRIIESYRKETNNW